jgi:hypothetical protein
MNRIVPLLVLSVLLVFGPAGSANSKDGQRRWTKTLKKGSEVVYKIVFLAEQAKPRQMAEFAVIGDGSTDVDIEVRDSLGQVVAQDTFFSDLALCRWVPTMTQEYTIRVKNLGGEDNVCTMGHN